MRHNTFIVNNQLFKILELDNINEVGDEIAEAIPESLSASDNLIMLEPVKVNDSQINL